jgi:hypothetical protein
MVLPLSSPAKVSAWRGGHDTKSLQAHISAEVCSVCGVTRCLTSVPHAFRKRFCVVPAYSSGISRCGLVV